MPRLSLAGVNFTGFLHQFPKDAVKIIIDKDIDAVILVNLCPGVLENAVHEVTYKGDLYVLALILIIIKLSRKEINLG